MYKPTPEQYAAMTKQERLEFVIDLQNARIEELKATLQGAETIMRRAELANAQVLQVIRAALDKDTIK